MRTLWENTYRGTIFNYKEEYVATVRLILSIPLDRNEVPENAPEVAPNVIVLIEDTILSPIDVIEFEPVSYTHLDVYKRQVLVISEWYPL